MSRIQVTIERAALNRMSSREITELLRAKGLDTEQPMSTWEGPQYRYSRIFGGITLPRKVVRVIKTCIGVVPMTEPWPGEMGVG